MLKNNRAEKLLSIYWFLILFIVAAGISYMVIDFYGDPYDVRSSEADILLVKIANCFSQGGYLVEDYASLSLAENCNLNFETPDHLDWEFVGQYYAEIVITDFETSALLFKDVMGEPLWRIGCLSKSTRSDPACNVQTFYSLTKDGGGVEVEITSIVRKTEKNVK